MYIHTYSVYVCIVCAYACSCICVYARACMCALYVCVHVCMRMYVYVCDTLVVILHRGLENDLAAEVSVTQA